MGIRHILPLLLVFGIVFSACIPLDYYDRAEASSISISPIATNDDGSINYSVSLFATIGGHNIPVKDATIFIQPFNNSGFRKEFLCRAITDENGFANFTASKAMLNKTTFVAVFCYSDPSLTCAIDDCLVVFGANGNIAYKPSYADPNGIGMDSYDDIDACDGASGNWGENASAFNITGTDGWEQVNLFVSSSMVLTRSSGTRVLSSYQLSICMPIAILLGLLIASMFYMGINPFFWFSMDRAQKAYIRPNTQAIKSSVSGAMGQAQSKLSRTLEKVKGVYGATKGVTEGMAGGKANTEKEGVQTTEKTGVLRKAAVKGEAAKAKGEKPTGFQKFAIGFVKVATGVSNATKWVTGQKIAEKGGKILGIGAAAEKSQKLVPVLTKTGAQKVDKTGTAVTRPSINWKTFGQEMKANWGSKGIGKTIGKIALKALGGIALGTVGKALQLVFQTFGITAIDVKKISGKEVKAEVDRRDKAAYEKAVKDNLKKNLLADMKDKPGFSQEQFDKRSDGAISKFFDLNNKITTIDAEIAQLKENNPSDKRIKKLEKERTELIREKDSVLPDFVLKCLPALDKRVTENKKEMQNLGDKMDAFGQKIEKSKAFSALSKTTKDVIDGLLSKDSITVPESEKLKSQLSGIKDEKLKSQISDMIDMKLSYGEKLNDQMDRMDEMHAPVHYALNRETEFQERLHSIPQSHIGNEVKSIALSLHLKGKEDEANKLIADFKDIGKNKGDKDAQKVSVIDVLETVFKYHPELANEITAANLVNDLERTWKIGDIQEGKNINNAQLQVCDGFSSMLKDGYTITKVEFTKEIAEKMKTGGIPVSSQIEITDRKGNLLDAEDKDNVLSKYGIKNDSYSWDAISGISTAKSGVINEKGLTYGRNEAIQAQSQLIVDAFKLLHSKNLEDRASSPQMAALDNLAGVLGRNGMVLAGLYRDGSPEIYDAEDKAHTNPIKIEDVKKRVKEDSWTDFSTASSEFTAIDLGNMKTTLKNNGYSFSGVDSEGNFLVKDIKTGKAVSNDDAVALIHDLKLDQELVTLKDVNVAGIRDSLKGTGLAFNGIDEKGIIINNSSGGRVTEADVEKTLKEKDASEGFTKAYAAFNANSREIIRENVIPSFNPGQNVAVPYQDVNDAMLIRAKGTESRAETASQLFDSLKGMLTSKESAENLEIHKELYERLEKFQSDDKMKNVFLVYNPNQKRFDLVDKSNIALPEPLPPDKESAILKQYKFDSISEAQASVMKGVMDQQIQFQQKEGGREAGAPPGTVSLSSLSFIVSHLYENEKNNLVSKSQTDKENRIYETGSKMNLTSAFLFDFNALFGNIERSSPTSVALTGASDEIFHKSVVNKDYDKNCLRNYFAADVKEELIASGAVKEKDADYAALVDYHSFINNTVFYGALSSNNTYFGGTAKPPSAPYEEPPPSGPDMQPTPQTPLAQPKPSEPPEEKEEQVPSSALRTRSLRAKETTEPANQPPSKEPERKEERKAPTVVFKEEPETPSAKPEIRPPQPSIKEEERRLAEDAQFRAPETAKYAVQPKSSQDAVNNYALEQFYPEFKDLSDPDKRKVRIALNLSPENERISVPQESLKSGKTLSLNKSDYDAALSAELSESLASKLHISPEREPAPSMLPQLTNKKQAGAEQQRWPDIPEVAAEKKFERDMNNPEIIKQQVQEAKREYKETLEKIDAEQKKMFDETTKQALDMGKPKREGDAIWIAQNHVVDEFAEKASSIVEKAKPGTEVSFTTHEARQLVADAQKNAGNQITKERKVIDQKWQDDFKKFDDHPELKDRYREEIRPIYSEEHQNAVLAAHLTRGVLDHAGISKAEQQEMEKDLNKPVQQVWTLANKSYEKIKIATYEDLTKKAAAKIESSMPPPRKPPPKSDKG